MNKNSFTMAEVLITLSIIGIVAAMTLPGIMGIYKKKQTVMQLKKVYSILSQALEQSQIKNSEYKYWSSGMELGAKKYFELYWSPYLNYLTYCDKPLKCRYSGTAPWQRNDLNGNLNYSLISGDLRAPCVLTDGTLVSFSIGEGGESALTENSFIFVDLNAGSAPNVAGIDLFVFEISKQDTIQAYGYNRDKSYIENNCKTQGMTCAALIINSGWEIDENYPWH